MQTSYGHLTYCTNIHTGEEWDEHFAILQQNVPGIKKRISPDTPFGIGLRLANKASVRLIEKEELQRFQDWLKQEQCYVFILNGFPYGGFHRTKVKDQVYTPDWTTKERTDYTKRLFTILAALLPEDMEEGGVSTAPLSYTFWHATGQRQQAFEHTTFNILQVVDHLIHLRETTGKLFHLDIEPEPDGLLGNGPEFFDWYERYLLPIGIGHLKNQFGYESAKAEDVIKQHIQLCYDVCHFAVGYEDHAEIVQMLNEKGIKVGRIQISAALKALMPSEQDKREQVVNVFRQFNESTYLHQVVAAQQDGSFSRYPDLTEALQDANNPMTKEWRSHFHVPLFVEDYGYVKSTQEDIRKVLSIHCRKPFTRYLEVETYTWEVLPEKLKQPLSESIIREMEWVIDFLRTR